MDIDAIKTAHSTELELTDQLADLLIEHHEQLEPKDCDLAIKLLCQGSRVVLMSSLLSKYKEVSHG